MACVLVVRRTPGRKAALNALQSQHLAKCARTEFARIAFLLATCKLLVSHQEAVQTLAGQPRSGNCPRSLCRTPLRTSLASAPGEWPWQRSPQDVLRVRQWGADGARVCALGCRTKFAAFWRGQRTDSERHCNRDFCDLRHRQLRTQTYKVLSNPVRFAPNPDLKEDAI